MSRIIAFVLLFVSFFSCKQNKLSKCPESYNSNSYGNAVKILVSLKDYYVDNTYYIETGKIEFPTTFLEKDNFRILYDNPCIYKKTLMCVLRDDKQHKIVKYIALHALFKLCIEDYLDILELVYKEYKKGKISYEVLNEAICQFEFSLEVIKNYKNLKLRKLLKSIQKDFKKQGINNEVTYIDKILSGEAWTDSYDFYSSGAAGYMPWYCGSRYN